jgi:hypothetical protein
MNMRILMTTIPRLTLRCAAPAALCLIGALASPRAVRAQLPVPTFGIAGGVSHFSLATTGSAPFGAVRLDLPLASLVLDGSLGAFRPNEGTVRRDVFGIGWCPHRIAPSRIWIARRGANARHWLGLRPQDN